MVHCLEPEARQMPRWWDVAEEAAYLMVARKQKQQQKEARDQINPTEVHSH
jgi:hypothetical protein